MRYLQGEEIAKAEKYMAEAVQEALKSRCNKSKRGVVIVKDGQIIGRGQNNPPLDIECKPSYCGPICGKYCVHGEQKAILDALGNGRGLEGSRMYHIKVKEGRAVNSGQPSCVDCSKLILEARIAEFVLKHDKGYGLYGAREFHELSLKHLKSQSENQLQKKEEQVKGNMDIGGTD